MRARFAHLVRNSALLAVAMQRFAHVLLISSCRSPDLGHAAGVAVAAIAVVGVAVALVRELADRPDVYRPSSVQVGRRADKPGRQGGPGAAF
jgi:multisubunit Na+/H+ antiporter MnhB subunit